MAETRIEIFYKDEKHFDKPMGSPRPRFRRVKQFVQTYMPTHYTKHKKFIADQMPDLKSEKDIKLTAEFYFPPLKSWSKKKLTAMLTRYKNTKPDLDNLLKTVPLVMASYGMMIIKLLKSEHSKNGVKQHGRC